MALAANAVGVSAIARTGKVLLNGWIDEVTIALTLYGFLISIAVATSARTFPLSFRVPSPRSGLLQVGLAVGLAGLGMRLSGDLAAHSMVAAVGQLLQAAALVLFFISPTAHQPEPVERCRAAR